MNLMRLWCVCGSIRDAKVSVIDPKTETHEGLGEEVKLTAQEVAKHCRRDDCWIILGETDEKKVYNVTEFLEDHPGGLEVILGYAGQDATVPFETVFHSAAAKRMTSKYYVGDLQQ